MLGNHSSLQWQPHYGTTFVIPNASSPHPKGLLAQDVIYAFQLTYEVVRTDPSTLSPSTVQVFAARDVYVWTSDEAADGGQRVATFPLKVPDSGKTYAYHICVDTFPEATGTTSPSEFINDALGRWEAATGLVRMTHAGNDCADYAHFIDQIVVETIDKGVMQGLGKDQIEDHVTRLVAGFDLTDLTDDDRKLNEIIFVDLPEDTRLDVLFADVSESIGLHPCVVGGDLGCAVPNPSRSSTGEFTTDIMLNGRKVQASIDGGEFNWDIPGLAFDICTNATNATRVFFSTVVHEGGHALGIGGTSESGGSGQEIHHAQIEDSIMKTGFDTDFKICSPTPFDVMAIYALYQTMD